MCRKLTYLISLVLLLAQFGNIRCTIATKDDKNSQSNKTAVTAADCRWSEPIDISNDRRFFAVGGNIDFDSSGNVHMSYCNFHDNLGGVYYTNNVSGAFLHGELVASTGGKPSGPRILVTPDQVIHIFWGKKGQYEITRPVSGGRWSKPLRLDTSHEGGYFCWAERNSAGDIYMMWLKLFDDKEKPRNALWGRCKPLGGDWGPVELVVAGTADNNFPVGSWVTCYGDSFYATYELNKRPYYRRRSADGSWGPSKEINDKGGWGRIAFSPTGNEMAAVWMDNSGRCDLDFRIFARFSYDGGERWGPVFVVSDGCWLFRHSEIIYDANGNLHIAYQGKYSDPVQFDMYYRARIDGKWGPIVNLTNTPSRTGAAYNAITSLGNKLYFTYCDNLIDGFEDVYIISKARGPTVAPK